MENRISNKIVDIKGRKFIINKFDPMFGAWMAAKVLGMSSPKGIDISKVIKELMGSNFDEFKTLQAQVLKYVNEELPGGITPVINSEGNIAVMGITASDLLSLFVQTLMFSLSDFFEEGEQDPQREIPEV